MNFIGRDFGDVGLADTKWGRFQSTQRKLTVFSDSILKKSQNSNSKKSQNRPVLTSSITDYSLFLAHIS